MAVFCIHRRLIRKSTNKLYISTSYIKHVRDGALPCIPKTIFRRL